MKFLAITTLIFTLVACGKASDKKDEAAPPAVQLDTSTIQAKVLEAANRVKDTRFWNDKLDHNYKLLVEEMNSVKVTDAMRLDIVEILYADLFDKNLDYLIARSSADDEKHSQLYIFHLSRQYKALFQGTKDSISVAENDALEALDCFRAEIDKELCFDRYLKP